METDPLSTSTPPVSETDATIEAMSTQTEDTAWEHYVKIGTAEYEQANQERIKDGKIKVSKLGDTDHTITLVASVKVDPSIGEAVSGHENRPDAESMTDTEKAFTEYQASTLPDQQMVIYEGDERLFEDRDEAIRQATDSGLAQYLARREEIPAIGAEPTEAETIEAMEQLGVSRQELLAHLIARGLEAHMTGESPDFIAGYINHQAATLSIEGFHEYSEEEKQAIVKDGKLDEVKTELTAKVSELLPTLNAIWAPAIDGRDLFVITDGNIELNPKLTGSVGWDKLGWNGSARVNEVARLAMEMRDRTIFHRILDAYKSGKSPFVVYGGSHIVTIEPAIRAFTESGL